MTEVHSGGAVLTPLIDSELDEPASGRGRSCYLSGLSEGLLTQ
jgi:hypothetical protein